MSSAINFQLPNRQHAKLLEELNTQFQPYADTAYGTFLTWWDIYNDLRFAELNGNIIVESSYPTDGKELAYTIVGAYRTNETIATLFEHLQSSNRALVIHAVPEYIIQSLDEEPSYSLTHDPNIAEYVISAQQHASLTDTHFLKIRHKVNHFENEYNSDDIRAEILTLNDFKIKQLLINSLHSWQNTFKNDKERSEGYVIDQSLRQHADIGMDCMGIFIKDRLVGFALFKILPKGYININHVKVCYEYKDVFIYTLHALAKHCVTANITHLNIEQDLGIEGLRTFKQRLKPIEMLNKYTIRPM